MKLNRGDIVIANLESVSKGSIQKYTRPYIIISNNKANQYSPVVTAVAMSTKTWKKKYLPTHCPIPAAKVKVTDTDFEVFDSMALCEQIVSIDVNVHIERVVASISDHTYSDRFMYKCSKRRKLTALCENKSSYEYNEVMDSVFSVIRQHMKLCIEKTKFVQKMNNRKENILQYDIYTKQIAKLQNDVRRITANKSGLYEDYREQLITAEELCQYQKEYESRVNEIEAQITELLYRRSLYEKDFHIDEGWEETVNKYLSKRKLTRELVEAFVSEIVFTDNNIEVKLLYDDFLKELLEVAEEREVGSNG